MLVNGGFEKRPWTDKPTDAGHTLNQQPFGWELSWLKPGDKLYGSEDVASGEPECVHKLITQLPPNEHPGGTNELIKEGETTYKLFSFTAKWGAQLRQVVTGLEPGSLGLLVVPLQLHKHGDLDPYAAEARVMVNGKGEWVPAEKHADRKWFNHTVSFVVPPSGLAEVVIQFKSKWDRKKDWFVDGIVFQASPVPPPPPPPDPVPVPARLDHVVTIYLTPQDTTWEEYQKVMRSAFDRKGGILYSADEAAFLAANGKEGSKVVAYGGPARWPGGDIVAWLKAKGVLVVETIPFESTFALGADVSWAQGEKVDFNKLVAAGHSFVFIRAGSGRTPRDANYDIQWQRAGQAKLLRGAYWYLYPNNTGVQATAFADLLKADAELPPVLDVEEAGLREADVRTFVETFRLATGQSPIIYTTASFWNALVPKSATWVEGCRLWIAQWTSNSQYIMPGPNFRPTLPHHWGHYDFWQWTSHGSYPGYAGRLDFNWFSGGIEALRTYSATYRNVFDLRRYKVAHPDCWRVVRHQASNGQTTNEDVQDMDLGGGLFVRRKGSNAEWHRHDTVFFYLIHDTSPSPGTEGVARVYTLYKNGLAGAPKSMVHQALGQVWTEAGTHKVQFRAKDGCRLLAENSGEAQNSSIVTRYEKNYTFNRYGQNLKIEEVIWEKTGVETQIYGRNDGRSCGWLGWDAPWGSSEPVEIYWNRGRLDKEPARICSW